MGEREREKKLGQKCQNMYALLNGFNVFLFMFY